MVLLNLLQDSFVVRTFNAHASQMPCISELPLKLARKCLDLFGWATFDEEIGIHTISKLFIVTIIN